MLKTELTAILADIMSRVRSQRPLIHHLTNWVVMNDTANVTLAMGALPIMAQAREEITEIVASAQALLINMGTLTAERLESILLAGQVAKERNIPVILDPVGVGVSTWRTESVRRILDEISVTVIRCNRAEAAALLGKEAHLRGVEDVGNNDSAQRVALAQNLARHYHLTAAITGARDVVSDGTSTFAIDNGHPLLTRITGSGCMVTTLVACCAAVERQALLAAATGLVIMGVAAEQAAATAVGPGSFKVALLDQIYYLNADDIRRAAKIVQLD